MGGELQELLVRTRRREAERPNALRNGIHGKGKLAVLRLEHQM